MSRAPTTTRAEWKPRRATETEPKLSRPERWCGDWPLWLVLSAIGGGMGYATGDEQVIFFGAVALAVAVTLWVRELRESRHG